MNVYACKFIERMKIRAVVLQKKKPPRYKDEMPYFSRSAYIYYVYTKISCKIK